MMKYLVILILLFMPSHCFGADFYIAQSAQGGGNGSNCANAHAIAGLTWNGGDINDGDTLHLCSDGGSFTTPLVIGDSGSEGSPYTIYFESGAKFSKAYWGTGLSAAIYGSAKSYIVIDGGTNGIIENTDNGSSGGSKGNQQSSVGIAFANSNNIEIKNLTIQNIYVRDVVTDYSDQANSGTGAIELDYSGSNMSVHDCTLTMASKLFYISFTGTVTNFNLYNNTITHCNTNAVIVTKSNNTSMTGVNIYNNIMNLFHDWNYDSAYAGGYPWHAECIHFYDDGGTGETINSIRIYNNTFGDETVLKEGINETHTTAMVLNESDGSGYYIYNNIFKLAGVYDVTDGMVLMGGNGTMANIKIYNNTFYTSGGGQGKNAISVNTDDDAMEIKNNIILDFGNGIYDNDTPFTLTSVTQIDYNVYHGVDNWGGSSGSWADWYNSGAGYDVHGSPTTEPALDANYIPLLGDTVAKWKGTATGQLSATDKAGTTWHSPPSIGAYEYGAGGSTQTTSGLTIQGVQIQ